MSPVTAPAGTRSQTQLPGAQAPVLRVVAAAPRMAPDRFTGTSAQRLLKINEEAGSLLVRALGQMVRNPGRTLKSFGAALVEPFVHPVRGYERCRDSFRRDGCFSGLLNTMIYLSTAVSTLSFVALGVAVLAAPFTGGASLAIAGIASQAILYSGFHDAAVMTVMLVKDEHDALAATTDEALDDLEESLADDFLDTFFAWATLPMSNASSALSVAPQGLMDAARASVKPAARASAARAGIKPAMRAGLTPAVHNHPAMTGVARRAGGRAMSVGARSTNES